MAKDWGSCWGIQQSGEADFALGAGFGEEMDFISQSLKVMIQLVLSYLGVVISYFSLFVT